ncbi:MAG: hypothetical protein ACJA1A_003402 [Saprospiraceae bacterium]|jgi:hypothetical protein
MEADVVVFNGSNTFTIHFMVQGHHSPYPYAATLSQISFYNSF